MTHVLFPVRLFLTHQQQLPPSRSGPPAGSGATSVTVTHSVGSIDPLPLYYYRHWKDELWVMRYIFPIHTTYGTYSNNTRRCNLSPTTTNDTHTYTHTYTHMHTHRTQGQGMNPVCEEGAIGLAATKKISPMVYVGFRVCFVSALTEPAQQAGRR